MKFSVLFKLIIRKIIGSLKDAQRQGMIVEDGVTVMGGVNFGSEPYLITLRKNCRISSNVNFVNHDGGTHAFRCWPKYSHVVKYGKIEIGENSFIGAESTIMPGVKIGSHCVIGAGSLVTKDVPNNSVVCGVPAHFVCTTEEYAEKCLAQMPEDFDYDAYIKDKKSYLISKIK